MDRASTPLTGSHAPYRDIMTIRTHAYQMQQHHAKYNSYPMMSSQATMVPMSSPWHPMTNGTDWMNSPHMACSSSYYRNNFSTPESGRLSLPTMSPKKSPSKNHSDSRTSRQGHHIKTMVYT